MSDIIMAKPIFSSDGDGMIIHELQQIIEALEKLNIQIPEDSQNFFTYAFNQLYDKKFTHKGNFELPQMFIDIVNQIKQLP